jgi:hypothetical protein
MHTSGWNFWARICALAAHAKLFRRSYGKRLPTRSHRQGCMFLITQIPEDKLAIFIPNYLEQASGFHSDVSVSNSQPFQRPFCIGSDCCISVSDFWTDDSTCSLPQSTASGNSMRVS